MGAECHLASRWCRPLMKDDVVPLGVVDAADLADRRRIDVVDAHPGVLELCNRCIHIFDFECATVTATGGALPKCWMHEREACWADIGFVEHFDAVFDV